MRSLRLSSRCRRNKTYVHDAQSEGDHELVEFFSSILENNLTATQRAKEMLLSRLQNK